MEKGHVGSCLDILSLATRNSLTHSPSEHRRPGESGLRPHQNRRGFQSSSWHSPSPTQEAEWGYKLSIPRTSSCNFQIWRKQNTLIIKSKSSAMSLTWVTQIVKSSSRPSKLQLVSQPHRYYWPLQVGAWVQTFQKRHWFSKWKHGGTSTSRDKLKQEPTNKVRSIKLRDDALSLLIYTQERESDPKCRKSSSSLRRCPENPNS